MSTTTHLWAIGYDDMARADQVRDEIIQLGWGAGHAAKYLGRLQLIQGQEKERWEMFQSVR